MGIEWRDIRGYEGIYQVSSLGEVRSLDRVITGAKNRSQKQITGRMLTPAVNGRGYSFVCLSKEGKRISKSVHRLVAEAFISKSAGTLEVNHINGIKTDNRVENLEWVTRRENVIHAYNTGLAGRGEKRYNAKLTDEIAREIYKSAHLGSASLQIIRDVAVKYGIKISDVTVSQIKHKKTWKHIHETA